MKVIVIGIGGIGSHLASWIARYLASLPVGPEPHTLTLVDGDTFELGNRTRQAFANLGKKATVLEQELSTRFPEIRVLSFAEYVTPENVDFVLEEEAIVLLCVDNHATRKVVSEACGRYHHLSLISGGNELTDGNIQVYLRRNGQDRTPSLTAVHPEIAHPKDRSPHELSCEELARSGSPQLLATNIMAASLMLNAFYGLTSHEAHFLGEAGPNSSANPVQQRTAYTEVHFDIGLNAARSIRAHLPSPVTIHTTQEHHQ